MDEKTDRKLREEGYIPLREYKEEQIIRNGSFFGREGAAKTVSAIRTYEEASAQFHQAGGDGYYIAQRCLQRYMDLKFLQKNRWLSFAGQAGEYEYVPKRKGAQFDLPVAGTQVNLYFMRFEKDRETVLKGRRRTYTSCGTMQLTTVMTELLEQAVSLMEEAQSAEIRECGRILRTAYMEPVYAELTAAEIYQRLGYSKKRYYRLRDKGVSLISEYLFGFFAGEKNAAEVYIRGEHIVAPDAEKFE